MPGEKNSSSEFQERISRLLLVCIDGMKGLLTREDALYSTLNKLGEVVKKATRPKPVTGIGKDIEDYYTRLKLETSFQETKNETVKQIVVNLSATLKEMVSASGDFDASMQKSIEKIQAAGDIQDILALKDAIVGEINRVRAGSQSLKKELEQFRKSTQTLSSRLEQTEAKALVDTLTNVLNRNAYNLKITQMIVEFARMKDTFCLFVVDIDKFKQFNDTYGHKSGDLVLRTVASAIQSNLRASDLVFRYGGEEFVVLLQGVHLDQAKRLGEKIRASVEKEYFVDKENKIRVTVSIGVAQVMEGDTEQSLFERADQAMYAAKKKGRNRVELIAP